MSRMIRTVRLAIASLALFAGSGLNVSAVAEGIEVTEKNVAVADSDRYFAEHQAEHAVNTIRHARAPSGPDNQFVITENRDVLYSHAVVDTAGGATIT